jgi:hypothetical protein
MPWFFRIWSSLTVKIHLAYLRVRTFVAIWFCLRYCLLHYSRIYLDAPLSSILFPQSVVVTGPTLIPTRQRYDRSSSHATERREPPAFKGSLALQFSPSHHSLFHYIQKSLVVDCYFITFIHPFCGCSCGEQAPPLGDSSSD